MDEELRAVLRKVVRGADRDLVLSMLAQELGLRMELGKVWCVLSWLPPQGTIPMGSVPSGLAARAEAVLAERQAAAGQIAIKKAAEREAYKANLLPEAVAECLRQANAAAEDGLREAKVQFARGKDLDTNEMEFELMPEVIAELQKQGFRATKWNWCYITMQF